MPELLGSADALGQMTNAAVTLGRAANMEMLPAAEALTGIMNQFGKSADFAGQAIDIMAAGSQAGSAELQNLQATMLEFGKAAVVSGIKFEEAINIAELISKTRKGSQAGVELRNIFVEMNKGFTIDEKARKTMQRLGIDIRMISNAAIPVKQRLQEMTKLFKDSSSFAEVFGKENEIAAITLLENIGLFDQMNERLKEQGVAARMAQEQTQTLYAALNRVKAAWTNIITESGGANMALTAVKNTLGFVANNLGSILNVIVPVIGFFAIWRGYILAMTIKAALFNGVIKTTNYLTGLFGIITKKNIMLIGGATETILGMQHATMLLNLQLKSFVFSAGGVLAILGALAMAFGDSYDSTRNYNAEMDDLNKNFKSMVAPLNEATIGLQEYNKALDEYREITNFNAAIRYNRNTVGGLRGFLNIIKSTILNPITAIQAKAEQVAPSIYMPEMNDYMKPEESAEFLRQDRARSSNTKTTQVIHHTLDITQNGRSIASFDTSGGMPSVSRTY